MDFTKLKRDPKYIRSLLDTKKNGEVWVKGEIDIYVLTKFEDYILLTITAEEVSCAGSFIMVSGNKFGIMSVAGLINLNPTVSTIEMIGEEQYYKFSYAKGTMFIQNRSIVVVSEIGYFLMDRYLFRGGIPSYLDAIDRVNIYTSYSKYNGVKVDSRTEMLDMLVSMSLRTKKDINIEHRHGKGNDKEIQSIALANVVHGKVSVINKISGSYQKAGLISAINTDVKIISPVEKVIRA